jgi:thioredoxin-like negative regulator of GroEL
VELLTAADFPKGRLARPGRWVVVFSADWCPYCHRFLPGFRESGAGLEATLAVADMTDEGSPLWDGFSIEVVPTVMVFEDGRATARLEGVLGDGLSQGHYEALVAGLRRRAPG